jgi:hypothetical protein
VIDNATQCKRAAALPPLACVGITTWLAKVCLLSQVYATGSHGLQERLQVQRCSDNALGVPAKLQTSIANIAISRVVCLPSAPDSTG